MKQKTIGGALGIFSLIFVVGCRAQPENGMQNQSSAQASETQIEKPIAITPPSIGRGDAAKSDDEKKDEHRLTPNQEVGAVKGTDNTGIRCETESCRCGEIFCGKNGHCLEGTCVCGTSRLEFSTDAYICEDNAWKCLGTGGFISCSCGSIECSIGSTCINGRECMCGNTAAPDYVAKAVGAWKCENDRWTCASGSRNGEKGCVCDTKLCGWGAACHNGQCTCGDSVFSGDPATYECQNGRSVCGVYEGCVCGATLCGQGGECRGNACYCGDHLWPFSHGTICENGSIVKA